MDFKNISPHDPGKEWFKKNLPGKDLQDKKFKIIIKTRGGHKEGMGDVTSSIAIAKEFTKLGNKVSFLVNNNKSTIELLAIHQLEFDIVNKKEDIKKKIKGRFYEIALFIQLNSPLEELLLLKNHTEMIVTLDDNGRWAQEAADLRFNPLYPVEGTYSNIKYISLSNIYKQKHRLTKHTDKVKSIMVTQGGSDTYGFTPKIIKGLSHITSTIEINVVLGPNFEHNKELKEVMQNSMRSFNIIKNKNDLSDLMERTDLAITGGGNTLFELACMGVPAIVVCGESFEEETAGRLQNNGYCLNLGFGKKISSQTIREHVQSLIEDNTLRKKMSKNGKKLVDGGGSERIAKAIIEYYKKMRK